ncbi:hypothetical protein GOHSU_55_00100 [Gordonia hirsuta DSM 44140 = NBRC 16056]|uniref:Bacterial proteasome activator n=1 Tax=Gordonia hirsuta DSM 44140 = NBRC 16056 TaxID=1121927 RepID=L7LCK0_9ACTN|nr:bacterial proteasome activator family protein [Gordonia hirsuta]GAC58855.1 hypothetical protein GOHSU_55_00100 [Gordonia hirsuta DSM 44140 = NBRC 16056]
MHPEFLGSSHPLAPIRFGSAGDGEPPIVVPDADPSSPMPLLPENGDGASDETGPGAVIGLVEQPAKVMRIGTMIKQLLEEVRSAPLDEASRQRLAGIHRTSVQELSQGLAPELSEELNRLALPFSDDVVPSDAELRIAQAQLVGWLEGVFHGIQTALFAQQMAARSQLEQMRHGGLPTGGALGSDGHSTGQYL